MRARVVWFALLAVSLFSGRVRADDFDDDFAQPKKPAPQAPAAQPRTQTAAPKPAAPKPKPAAPKKPSSFAAFDDAAEGQAATEQAHTSDAEEASEEAGEAASAPVSELIEQDPDYYRDDSVPAVHSTIEGLVGGIHVVDGGSAPRHTFRIGLTGEFFKKNGFIASGDEHRRLASVLAVSFTPIEHLELAASISGYATENLSADPTLVQALGDTSLMAKGYGAVLPWLSLSGDMTVQLLNGTGSVGYSKGATSVGLRGAVTADLRKTKSEKPVILRANLRYLFDNSRRLIDDVEKSRYASLQNPAPEGDEYRHLVTAVERYQLGANRVDSMTLSFGAEFPIQIAQNVDIHPIIEWAVALPVNRQGYDCLVASNPSDHDSCLAREGFAARTSNLTLGVRGEPGVRGLGLLLAVDVATSGNKTFVRELAPNSSYQLIGSLSYAYDTRPPKPMIIEREVEAEVEEPVLRGHIRGQVFDKEGAQPVAKAIVHIEGAPLSDLATDADGKFESYDLDPGSYALTISAPDYKDGTCGPAELPEGGAGVDVRCELEALPRVGGLHGRVTALDGSPVVGASVELRGPTAETVKSDASGAFAANDLSAGSYEARVEAPGYLMKAAPFQVEGRKEASVEIVLVPVPKERLTELKAKNIRIKKQVQFVADSAEISEKSTVLLADIADVMIRNPQLAQVEVQGHTDYTGTAGYNQELSQQRADAVRSWLIASGVEASRLTAVGYGRTRPIAPNITEANRALNRRVEFVILETKP
jgi:outer membrane protein OmpA-like peptidoglycan-associated protein